MSSDEVKRRCGGFSRNETCRVVRDASYDTHRDPVNPPVIWHTQITDDERLGGPSVLRKPPIIMAKRCCGLVVG